MMFNMETINLHLDDKLLYLRRNDEGKEEEFCLRKKIVDAHAAGDLYKTISKNFNMARSVVHNIIVKIRCGRKKLFSEWNVRLFN